MAQEPSNAASPTTEQAAVDDQNKSPAPITATESDDAPSSVSKGKRKAQDEPSDDSSSGEEDDAGSDAEEPQWHTEAQETAAPAQPKGVKAVENKRPKAGDWEAIWSAQHNAYYFHNTKTKETTWTNPMTEGAATKAQSAPQRPVTAEDYGGVDPELAYLDPSIRAGSSGGSGSLTARFNARTGKFEGDPSRNPEHHSDFSRAKRQSSFFFDVDAWQKQRELEQANQAANPDAGQKRAPTKKELEMYKAKKQERKKAKLMARYGD